KKSTSAKNTASTKAHGKHSAPTRNSSRLSNSNASAESETDHSSANDRSNTLPARPMFWPESWTTPNNRQNTASTQPKSSTISVPTDQKPPPSRTASSYESIWAQTCEPKVWRTTQLMFW